MERVALAIMLILSWMPGAAADAATGHELGDPPLRAWDEAALGGHFQNFAALVAKDGRVLVGNGSGVLEFDGVRWRLLPTPQGTRVRDLAADRDRVLYATVDDFGEVVTDDTGRSTLQSWRERLPHPAGTLGDIYDITETRDALLVQTSQRLLVLDAAGYGDLPAQGGFQVGAFCGGRYVLQERARGLVALGADRRSLEPVPGGDRFLNDLLMGCSEAADGSTVFAWRRAGLVRWRDAQWTPVPSDADSWLAAHMGLRYAPLRDGGAVIVGVGGGALFLDPQGRRRFALDRASGLPSSTLVGVAAAPDGTVWLAGEGGVAAIAWPRAVTAFGARHEIGAVQTVTRHRGELIVGSLRGTFALRPGPEGRSFTPLDGLPSQAWRVLEIEGDLWVAGIGGVFRTRLDPATGEPGSIRRMVESRFAFDLVTDADGNVFASTDAGIVRVMRDGGATPFDDVAGEWREVVIDADGALWAGASNQRLVRIEAPASASPRVIHYDPEALPPGDIRPVRVAERILIATSQGLLEPVPGDALACARGFDASFCGEGSDVHRIIAVRGEHVWMHRNGRTGRATRSDDGLYRWGEVDLGPHLRQLPASGWTDADGVIWIATNYALVRHDPALALPTAAPAAPRVSAMLDGGQQALSLVGSMVRPLEVGTRALRFEFEWRHDPLAHPYEFRSRLEPHDDAWTAWRAEAFRDVSGLVGGDYSLAVQARDADGTIADAQDFRLSIARPWYLHTWALAAWSLLVLLAMRTIARAYASRRTARLSMRNIELQRAVDERTRELDERAQEIAAQNRRLQDLDRAKTRFFAGISHEFRTPLTLILAPLESLRRGEIGRIPARVDQELGLIQRNATQLAVLIDQILEVNRSAVQGLHLDRRTVDLAQLVRHAASLFQSLAENQGRRVVVSGADRTVLADVDARQVHRALLNLIGNALKYSATGTEVDVSLGVVGDAVSIAVSDRGPGISPEDLPHVFDLYYRGRPLADARPVGSGIGLSLVQAVAQAHGGRVEVDSDVGVGSTFTLHLPIGPVSGTESWGEDFGDEGVVALYAVQDPRDERHAAMRPDLPAVLLADDNAELRDFIARRLRLHYRVLQAGDGVEALAIARRELPDVIVSDWRMPASDGLALCREVRSDPMLAGVGLVMVAGPQEADDATRALSAGADDYLAKPFDLDELRARIAGLLRARRRIESRTSPPDETSRPPIDEDPWLASARAFVVRHLDESDWGVTELADALHMDRSALFRRIKATAATAPVDFIRGIRLDAARERLLRRDGAVSEIAYACGFESLSYFSRVFRARFGVLPSECTHRGGAPAPPAPHPAATAPNRDVPA